MTRVTWDLNAYPGEEGRDGTGAGMGESLAGATLMSGISNAIEGICRYKRY